MDIDLNLFKKKKLDPKKSYKRRIDMVNNRKKYSNLLNDNKSISVTKLDYNQKKKNDIIEINHENSKESKMLYKIILVILKIKVLLTIILYFYSLFSI